jgi:hypothetical protein
MFRLVSGRLLPPVDAGGKSVLGKVMTTYFEYATAGKMAQTVAAHQDTDDVERIDYAIRRTQMRILNHIQLPHDPHDWPVLVAGFGYCDQINSAVAQILAHSFRHAQVYALYDPVTKSSPHSIGRVWSDQRHEWLYFDAFFDRPIVYRQLPGGHYEILNSPTVTYANRLPPLVNDYRLSGWVLKEYPAWWPEYLWAAAAERLGTTAAPPPGPIVIPPPSPAAPDTAEAPVATDPHVYATVVRRYVIARADDLFGDRDRARLEYRVLATDPAVGLSSKAILFRDAAREFARH